MTDTDRQYRRYLGLLRLEDVRPDLADLRLIVRRHLIEVPFENISKRLAAGAGQTTIPDLDSFLGGIEQHRFGGTCYANNYYLHCLLRHVGFDIRLCGADMGTQRDVHMAMVVACEGREYLVDCGFAAPFFEPLPLDLPEPYVVRLGREHYVLHPRDAEGRSRIEFFRRDALRHGYLLTPAARTLHEFSAVIARSYAPDAFFMNTVWIARFSERGSVILKERSLTHHIGGRAFMETVAEADLPGAVAEVFGMSADDFRRALAATPAAAR
ncbi:MAG: arylamine N-acetyltransferase [Gammaproteobacteria bacterium]|nr:arylamine N-acetyltransferase [Gammaproteobacteria bacterium]